MTREVGVSQRLQSWACLRTTAFQVFEGVRVMVANTFLGALFGCTFV